MDETFCNTKEAHFGGLFCCCVNIVLTNLQNAILASGHGSVERHT